MDIPSIVPQIPNTQQVNSKILKEQKQELYELAKDYFYHMKNEIFHDSKNTHLRKSGSLLSDAHLRKTAIVCG